MREITMYDEAEYIYQEFQKHFWEKKKEPVVLYGIGKNTGKLLSKISDYNIPGLEIFRISIFSIIQAPL